MKAASVFLALSVTGAVTAAAATAVGSIPDIPYEKLVLDNGLTVLLHEDHKAPIVAVNVWYHVGSKNEKRGRTGFAHLFEHLMFNGSENFNDDYFQAMVKVGATDLNGTTNVDRTNYFQNVPTSALDLALFMESDRMGHLLGAIDQAKLDEQRGVVQNEKRQGENQPYGVTRQLLAENTYPNEHPYSWTTIGEMADLTAATLEDVHEWFKTYYGPNNAVIAIAGDIDPEAVKKKVQEYFGDIPPGPPIARHDKWIAKLSGTHRVSVQDRVPQARIYKVWNLPGWGSRAAIHADLITDVLSSGKSSRLYKRLVYDDQIATDVAAYIWAKEIGSQVYIRATARPGGDLRLLEKAIDEELARFLKDGATAEELERSKAQQYASFVRGAERIGGFGGKSDILASNMVYTGNPEFYKKRLKVVAAVTPEDLRKTAKEWLSDGVFILEVHPFSQMAASGEGVDRSGLPEVADPPAPEFASFQRATLSNGLKVVLAQRQAVPLVSLDLLVDGGFAADQGGTPGAASLAVDMLDEGTKTRTALQISDELLSLGATLNTASNLDTCFVSMSTLKDKLGASLEIFADVVLSPSFPEADFQRLKQQQLARIQREKVSPMQMGLRVFPSLLYGSDHSYGIPFTGSGTEEAVASLTREQLAAFHGTWFRPNNATLVVVGAVSMAELKPELERLFATWKKGDVPEKNIATVAHKKAPTVYVIDRPGSQQSVVFAGHVMPRKSNPDEIAIETMNNILGGTFTARINMNLREDKHWTYGARSMVIDARGQRPFLVFASVQGDKTSDSMQEILKELNGITGAVPATDEELGKAKANLTLTLPGRWETNRAVAASLNEIVEFGLPDDYFDTFPDRVRSLDVGSVNGAASSVIKPGGIVWVVVGDLAQIEEGIRALDFGDVKLIDVDGNEVR